MEGVSFNLDSSGQYLDLMIMPAEIEKRLEAKAISRLLNESEFKNLFVFEDAIKNAVASFKNSQKTDSFDPIIERIAEKRDAIAKFRLSEDEMKANLELTSAYGGEQANLSKLLKQAKKMGIKRGLSRKIIETIVAESLVSIPGTVFDEPVAKGLPPRHGRNSKLKPLVDNALDRILKPKEKGNSKVDMRDLGDIICVKAGTPVVKRMPPTDGRAGYTVTGTPIDPMPGQWVSLKPGSGTMQSPDDENVLVAEINGMPKFKDEKMWVDDTFICKGCNVGTGNINYDGAVLINGDVTEKMTVVASGDITVNGFVESATLQAGGDIIITEGAMGKVNESDHSYSTVLEAHGGIHVAHGQGLDIMCNGNVTIGRQLAYSRINCRGTVTAGPLKKPNGNLFACEISSYGIIKAGTIGAVSGSTLSIDFSMGLNQLMDKKDQLDELWVQLQQNTRAHETKINFIKSKKIPWEFVEDVNEAISLFKNEQRTLTWLENKISQIKLAKDQYIGLIGVEARDKIFPGVVLKLNNRTWKAEREYQRAKIHYEGHKWQFAPMTRR